MYIVVYQNIRFFSNWAEHPQVILRIRLDKITQGFSFFSTQSQSVRAAVISDILAIANNGDTSKQNNRSFVRNTAQGLKVW